MRSSLMYNGSKEKKEEIRLFGFFKNNFLDVNLKDYPNLGIDFEINKFLLALAIALCVVFFFIDYRRGTMQILVKQLFRHECYDENSAKTLGDLGLSNKLPLKYYLSHSTLLSRIVARVGAVKYSYEEYAKMVKEKTVTDEKVDFETARFYLDEKYKERAKFVYETYASSIPKTCAWCVLVVLLIMFVAICMPEILSWLNDVVGELKA